MAASVLHSTFYYTGAQCRAVFGDILVEELNSIQFDIVTNRSPVYGYGSTYYDCIAEGNYLVNGAFAVNYIHPQYVLAIIEGAGGKKPAAAVSPYQAVKTTKNIDAWTAALNDKSPRALRHLMGIPTEDLIELRRQKAIKSKNADLKSDLAGFHNAKPFDISLYIGENIQKITGVILTSSARSLMSNGEPIMETYRFTGRYSN
jgi:hypothetical protein